MRDVRLRSIQSIWLSWHSYFLYDPSRHAVLLLILLTYMQLAEFQSVPPNPQIQKPILDSRTDIDIDLGIFSQNLEASSYFFLV